MSLDVMAHFDQDDEPDVVEEGLEGWVWNRDLRGARFYRNMFRLSTGTLGAELGSEVIWFSIARSQVFPSEVLALQMLMMRHQAKARNHQQQAYAIAKRIKRLQAGE